MAAGARLYRAMAEAIKINHDAAVASGLYGEDARVESVASDLAEVLKADNPRFDRDKFMAACGCD